MNVKQNTKKKNVNSVCRASLKHKQTKRNGKNETGFKLKKAWKNKRPLIMRGVLGAATAASVGGATFCVCVICHPQHNAHTQKPYGLHTATCTRVYSERHIYMEMH